MLEDGGGQGFLGPSDGGLLFTSLAETYGVFDMDPLGSPILVSPVSQQETWNWEKGMGLPGTHLPASPECVCWAWEGR